MLYGCDGDWWKLHNGVPEFKGIKITNDARTCVVFSAIHKIEVKQGEHRLLVEHPGQIGDGGNSGFQALNIAVQFGVTRIVLVGFDMRLDRGAHWHGKHPRGLNNPNDVIVMQWRRRLNAAADDLASLGVEVLNASPISALTAFPIVSLAEAFDAECLLRPSVLAADLRSCQLPARR